MIKPYQVTKESRYLGLPLGFGVLGATYLLSAVIYAQPQLFGNSTLYFQLFVRNVAFIFLCVTYYFSRKSPENTRSLWNITFVGLFIAIIALFIILNIPEISLPAYRITSIYSRCFNLIFIVYICAHTIRSHLESSNPDTLWTPFGYIFLGISQYLVIIFALDGSLAAFFSGLAFRWVGFALFLYVSFKSFYSLKKKENSK